MKEVFEEYVKNYDMSDLDIAYKYKHSYRVMALSKWLSEELKLDKKDIELATIIGLYHDIGRFEEDKRFDSFGVHRDFDHGDYGRDILLKERLVEKIQIEEKYYSLIAKAVEMHNKYSIEKGLDEKTDLHCKIIRDADKIDILRSMGKGLMQKKHFNIEAKGEDLAEDVREEFYKNVQIRKRAVSKHSDANKVLCALALVYDINYMPSLKFIKENKIIDALYNILKDKESFKEYFDHINEYIKRRMENVRN